MLLTIAAQAPVLEKAPLFGRVDPAWEQLQRMRAPYNWASIWIGRWWLHYTLLFAASGAATWRIRRKLSDPLLLTVMALPVIGIVSVPVSYLLLEVLKWTVIPQFQPARALVFVTLFAAILCSIAAVLAAQSRKYVESALFLLAPLAVPFDNNITALLTPFESPLLAKRLAIVCALALFTAGVLRLSHRWRPITLLAALLPFLVVPTTGEVRNYPALHQRELNEMAAWARQFTPKDAVFYFADLNRELEPGVFRARSKRALYVDWKAGGQVNFHRRFSELWLERWEAVQRANTLADYGRLGIDYVVYSGEQRPSGGEQVYANNAYSIYRVPEWTVIRIGPAGWSYKDWAGIVYPKPLPRDFHATEYLSHFFDTLEINSSFYGTPTAKTTSAWARHVAANERFRFTAKLWRGFTHEQNATAEDEKLFKEGMAPLMEANRLGAVLMQFPWSFKNTPEAIQYLLSLHGRFSAYPLVLEVRHSSWNDEAVLEILSEVNIGFCNIDQPRIGRSLRPTAEATSAIGYIRLHGRNYRNWFTENQRPSDRYDYLYSIDELEPWVDRVKAVAERTRSTYVVSNNHFEGKAVVNALQLAAMLRDEPVDIPEPLIARYPELRQLSATGN
jgi:uncharacterized protein YecE (DUF72 family)